MKDNSKTCRVLTHAYNLPHVSTCSDFYRTTNLLVPVYLSLSIYLSVCHAITKASRRAEKARRNALRVDSCRCGRPRAK